MLMELYVRITNWLRREEGQDLVEYALLAGLIAVVLIVILTTIGEQIQSVFSRISSVLSAI
jgi:pilus assembly protein Flp/PilA